MKRLFVAGCALTLLLGIAVAAVAAQEQLLVSNRGFASVLEVMQRSCELCHDWAGSHQGLADPAVMIGSGIAVNRGFPRP